MQRANSNRPRGDDARAVTQERCHHIPRNHTDGQDRPRPPLSMSACWRATLGVTRRIFLYPRRMHLFCKRWAVGSATAAELVLGTSVPQRASACRHCQPPGSVVRIAEGEMRWRSVLHARCAFFRVVEWLHQRLAVLDRRLEAAVKCKISSMDRRLPSRLPPVGGGRGGETLMTYSRGPRDQRGQTWRRMVK